jgi:hypothetical protein
MIHLSIVENKIHYMKDIVLCSFFQSIKKEINHPSAGGLYPNQVINYGYSNKSEYLKPLFCGAFYHFDFFSLHFTAQIPK